MGKFYSKKSKTISRGLIKSVSEGTDSAIDLVVNDDIKIVEQQLPEIKKHSINTIIKSSQARPKELPKEEIVMSSVEIEPIKEKPTTKTVTKQILKTPPVKEVLNGSNKDNEDKPNIIGDENIVIKRGTTIKQEYKDDVDYSYFLEGLDKDFLDFSGFNKNFTGYLNDKEIYPKVFELIKNIEVDKKIHKIVNLCYGFKKDPEFTFFNYLCVLSIVNKIKPDKIILYHHYDIKGKWWDRAKIYLKTVKTELIPDFMGNEVEHFAHMSDIVRLEMLRFAGGIYMDIDTFVNKSFDDLLDNEFVIGIQNSGGRGNRDYYGLCNAIMLSEKRSLFATEWIKSYKDFNQSKWDFHSVVKPYYIAKEFPDNVTILSPKKFFPFLWNEAETYLLTNNALALAELNDSYSMHLWETNEQVTLSKIDYNAIFDKRNNIYHLFKDYLIDNRDATVSFIFLTHNRPEKTIGYVDTYIRALNRKDVKEVIVYDNGSTDEELLAYLNYINTINGVKVIFGPDNIGVAGGRDVLFKNVTADVVFSVDSDSKLKDESFIDDAKEVLNDKNIWICGTVGAFFNGWVHGTHEDVNDDSSYEGEVDTLAGCCQIFRTEILNHIWVDLDFAPFWYEDTDFCFQAKVLGGKIYRFHFNNKFYHVWGGSGNKIFGNSLFEEKHKIMLKKWKKNKKLKLMYQE